MGPIKTQRKRSVQDSHGPSKKRKVSSTQGPASAKKRGKASERGTIPIPLAGPEEFELSEEDTELLQEYASAAVFLKNLDETGISRSKKETERLHRLSKMPPVQHGDGLPPIDSDESDRESCPSESYEILGRGDLATGVRYSASEGSDEEMLYEKHPRKRRPSWDLGSENEKGIARLPVKLADGTIKPSNARVHLPQLAKSGSEGESSSEKDQHQSPPSSIVGGVSAEARFGRPAVAEIMARRSRKARIQLAKEQIARICQEVLSDPENNINLLRRLHTFSLPNISTPSNPDPILNDPAVRRLAILSQLAVFKDIIPGFRIRPLTEKEQLEKVSQMVQRTRDWEQGLVKIYQGYLKVLETEAKARSELATVALQCMCTLLTEATHFNFRMNLMSSIVASLSRKSWDEESNLCLDAITSIFRTDATGDPSLEIVRLLNRMVKDRGYKVHPNVLSCLLHLRLRNEHGVRSSHSKADKATDGSKTKQSSNRTARRQAKGKATERPHLSKKAKKVAKENEEIQKEMREAEAEVDKEERANVHTETLKLLFALYFRILKHPEPTPLLPAALRGISRFAHLVNVDFFKDLMQVLKSLMSQRLTEPYEAEHSALSDVKNTQRNLLCIATAFELLSGQGEALQIDLTDFTNQLYIVIPHLDLATDFETQTGPSCITVEGSPKHMPELLFRALSLAFSSRSSVSSAPPPWRSAAFAKRLLTASLHWPPAIVVRALSFVKGLVEREPKLEALLSTDDRCVNGAYRPDLDDPQLCNPFGTSFWEVHLLSQTHWDPDVRTAAKDLLLSAAGST